MSEVELLAVQARGGGRPPRLDRIAGPDRTGTAFAVVDAVGSVVDLGLHPGWWVALGPIRVAAGLLEAVTSARAKAALVPFILRRYDHHPSSIVVIKQPTPGDDGFVGNARGRIAEASRLIDESVEQPPAARVITGPRELFRLHVRGGRADRAEVAGGLTAADADRVVADAREAFAALAGHGRDGLASPS
ncbi:hypothetical protein [Actinoplanes sp. NPDC026619]|uniref:hypothetical protein n=1 Tax=Actinoplanes sp. NPDC026619 TaxID=3155798 RepID=UPI0033FADF7A